MNIDKSSWIHLPLSQNPQIHLPFICLHLDHRELILEGKCDIAPGHKNKQYIYKLADCIQLKPVQATKTHLVDSISVHSNIKQRTVLPTERGYFTLFAQELYRKTVYLSLKKFSHFPNCMYSLWYIYLYVWNLIE